MRDLTFWIAQILNGAAFSMLLFTVSTGLSVTMGFMGVVDLTCGVYFLLGGYIGYTVIELGGNFFMALVAAAAVVALLASGIHRFLLEKIHTDHMAQVLMTFGVIIIIADTIEWIWRGVPKVVPAPAFLVGPAFLGDVVVPKYRLFLIVVGLVLALVLWFIQERTSLGVTVRAAHDDPQMLQATGVDVSRLWTLTYAAGAGLAGAGGVLAGPLLGLSPGLDMQILLLTFVVLIVGGLGTLSGVLAGSFTVGLFYTFGIALFPSVALFIIFVPMAVILLVRPAGLVIR